MWLAPDAIATWEAVGGGTRGGQRQYSDLAIETARTLRLIVHLPLPALTPAHGTRATRTGACAIRC